MVGILRYR